MIIFYIRSILTIVLVGRPYMYGLALAGSEGVEQVVRGLLCETEITLGLCGYTSIDQIWHKREEFMQKIEYPGMFSA